MANKKQTCELKYMERGVKRKEHKKMTSTQTKSSYWYVHVYAWFGGEWSMIKTAEVVSEKDFSFSVCNCANELIFLKKGSNYKMP